MVVRRGVVLFNLMARFPLHRLRAALPFSFKRVSFLFVIPCLVLDPALASALTVQGPVGSARTAFGKGGIRFCQRPYQTEAIVFPLATTWNARAEALRAKVQLIHEFVSRHPNSLLLVRRTFLGSVFAAGMFEVKAWKDRLSSDQIAFIVRNPALWIMVAGIVTLATIRHFRNKDSMFSADFDPKENPEMRFRARRDALRSGNGNPFAIESRRPTSLQVIAPENPRLVPTVIQKRKADTVADPSGRTAAVMKPVPAPLSSKEIHAQLMKWLRDDKIPFDASDLTRYQRSVIEQLQAGIPSPQRLATYLSLSLTAVENIERFLHDRISKQRALTPPPGARLVEPDEVGKMHGPVDPLEQFLQRAGSHIDLKSMPSDLIGLYQAWMPNGSPSTSKGKVGQTRRSATSATSRKVFQKWLFLNYCLPKGQNLGELLKMTIENPATRSIDNLPGLTTRAHDALVRINIRTLGQLLRYSSNTLEERSIKNGTLKDVQFMLSIYGLSLPEPKGGAEPLASATAKRAGTPRYDDRAISALYQWITENATQALVNEPMLKQWAASLEYWILPAFGPHKAAVEVFESAHRLLTAPRLPENRRFEVIMVGDYGMKMLPTIDSRHGLAPLRVFSQFVTRKNERILQIFVPRGAMGDIDVPIAVLHELVEQFSGRKHWETTALEYMAFTEVVVEGVRLPPRVAADIKQAFRDRDRAYLEMLRDTPYENTEAAQGRRNSGKSYQVAVDYGHRMQVVAEAMLEKLKPPKSTPFDELVDGLAGEPVLFTRDLTASESDLLNSIRRGAVVPFMAQALLRLADDDFTRVVATLLKKVKAALRIPEGRTIPRRNPFATLDELLGEVVPELEQQAAPENSVHDELIWFLSFTKDLVPWRWFSDNMDHYAIVASIQQALEAEVQITPESLARSLHRDAQDILRDEATMVQVLRVYFGNEDRSLQSLYREARRDSKGIIYPSELDRSVTDLPLSVGARKFLERLNIRTIRQLRSHTVRSLIEQTEDNSESAAVIDVRVALKLRGIELFEEEYPGDGSSWDGGSAQFAVALIPIVGLTTPWMSVAAVGAAFALKQLWKTFGPSLRAQAVHQVALLRAA